MNLKLNLEYLFLEMQKLGMRCRIFFFNMNHATERCKTLFLALSTLTDLSTEYVTGRKFWDKYYFEHTGFHYKSHNYSGLRIIIDTSGESKCLKLRREEQHHVYGKKSMEDIIVLQSSHLHSFIYAQVLFVLLIYSIDVCCSAGRLYTEVKKLCIARFCVVIFGMLYSTYFKEF